MFFIENRQFGRQVSLRGDIQCGQPLEQVSMSQAPALRVAFADAPLAEFLPRLALGDVGHCEGLSKAFIRSSMCEILQIGSPAMGKMRGGEGIVKNPFELHCDNPLLLNCRCDNTPRDRPGIATLALAAQRRRCAPDFSTCGFICGPLLISLSIQINEAFDACLEYVYYVYGRSYGRDNPHTMDWRRA